MKLSRLITAAAVAMTAGAIATTASAAGSVSLGATATAIILSPVTLTKLADINFGSIIRPGTGTNTVAVDAAGTATITGAGDGSLVAGGRTAARFNVNAPAGTTYTTNQTLALAGLGNPTATTPVAGTGTLGTIPAAGVQELRIGGSFDVNSSTTAQTYTGTLTLTVNYP